MADHDPAASRFYFIMFHRLVGVVLVLLGAMNLSGALDWGESIGWLLMIVGLFDFFVTPLIFARMWKSKTP